MVQVHFLGNATPSQMMGFVIFTETKTIIVDGGTRGDAQQILELLSQYNRTNIDTWFFTHPHHDHIGAFIEIIDAHPEIAIDKVCHHFPPHSTLIAEGVRLEREPKLWADFFNYAQSHAATTKVTSVGDCYCFDELSVRVLRVYHDSITENRINNSSSVYRLETPQKQLLILGDLGVEGGNELMATYSADMLSADYTQMAHHGQGGVSKEFYQYVCPKCCLWPAPEWLWNNDFGDGFDTSIFQTVRTREWMEEIGVTEHIVQKDGTAIITLS